MSRNTIICMLVLGLFITAMIPLSDTSAEYSVGWGDAELIDAEDVFDVMYPEVAVDAEGNAVAVWAQIDGLRYNVWADRYEFGSGWQGAEIIDGTDVDVYQPVVAMDSSGNALVVWSQYDDVSMLMGLMSRSYQVGEGWSEIVAIETDHTGSDLDPVLAMDSKGNAIVAWNHYDGVRYNVWASVCEVGSSWSSPFIVETNDTHSADRIALNFDGNGNAIITWRQHLNLDDSLWSRRYSLSSGWTSAEMIVSDAPNIYGSLAVAENGNATYAFSFKNQISTKYEVWAINYYDGFGWEAPVKLYADTIYDGGSPSVGVDRDGNALAVWSRSSSTSHYRLFFNEFTKESGWTPSQEFALSYSEYDVLYAKISMNAEGSALIVFGLSPPSAPASIWAVTYDLADGWGAIERISPDALFMVEYWLVAISNSGSGMVIYIQGGTLYKDLWAVSYTAQDTTPPSVSITSPTDDAIVSSSSVTITGTTEPGAYLVINGVVVAVGDDGSFSMVLALLEGENVVTATATDPAGNLAKASITITYEDPIGQLLDDITASLDSLSAEIDQILDALNQTSSELDQFTSELALIEEELEQISSELDLVQEGLDSTSSDLALLEDEFDQALSELLLVREQLNQTLVVLEQTSADLNETNDELTQNSDELDELKDSLDSVGSESNGTASQSLVLGSVLGLAIALLVLISIMYVNLKRKIESSGVKNEEPPPPEQ